jgi:hypothetical protein
MTRRDLLLGSGMVLSRSLFAASDFWNKKKPGEWSGQEVKQLVSHSPWAKDTRVELKTAGRGGYDGGAGTADQPTLHRPNTEIAPMNAERPGLGTPGELPGEIGDARRGSNGNVPMDALASIVRWESAQPLVDALHTNFPPEFANHYVIGVSGLPALQGREFLPGDEGQIERFKGSASLSAKGKTSYQPGVVRRSAAGMWFGFAKEFMPLTPTDKDVTFALNTAQLELKARFDPKEMVYLGKLAV